jgi:hypothetical protein
MKSALSKENIKMPGLYTSNGYNLDRMELTWMWLDSQAERINEECQKKDQTEKENEGE